MTAQDAFLDLIRAAASRAHVSLSLMPITIKAARAFVAAHHRHHRAPVGALFCLAACCDLRIVGVAVVGRPASRVLDNGTTAEVTRLCTDGTRNACSFLYGACRRAAKALGYKRLITYILSTELGSSLKASNWVCTGLVAGRSWSCAARPRTDKHPTSQKQRWEST